MLQRKSGYVYVVEFTNGAIKVGMSRNPRFRTRTYGYYCRMVGTEMKDLWISPMVIDARFEEREMIRNCLEWGGEIIHGKEWFSGIDFNEVVQHTSLFMEIASDEDLINEAATIDTNINRAIDRLITTGQAQA